MVMVTKSTTVMTITTMAVVTATLTIENTGMATATNAIPITIATQPAAGIASITGTCLPAWPSGTVCHPD